MKKNIFIALLLVVAASLGASKQEEFRRANALYTIGKYNDSLQIYRHLLLSTSSWKTHFNIGNAFYKTNCFLEAKIHYLKARKLNPFDQRIETNLRLVNRCFLDKIPPQKSDPMTQLFLRPLAAVDEGTLAVLLILFSIAANFSLILIIQGKRSRFIVYGASIILVLLLMTVSMMGFRFKQRTSDETAVVIREIGELRSGPGSHNTTLFSVHSGLEVRLIERSGEWAQVAASPQVAGWIEADAIESI